VIVAVVTVDVLWLAVVVVSVDVLWLTVVVVPVVVDEVFVLDGVGHGVEGVVVAMDDVVG